MDNLSEIKSCVKSIGDNELFEISGDKLFSYTINNNMHTFQMWGRTSTGTKYVYLYQFYGDIVDTVNTNENYSYMPPLKIRAKTLGTMEGENFFTNGVPKYISIEGYDSDNKIKIFNGAFSNFKGRYYVGSNIVNSSGINITTKEGSVLSAQFGTSATTCKTEDDLYMSDKSEADGTGEVNPFNPGITPKSYEMNIYKNHVKKELYTIADYYSYDIKQLGKDSYGRG